MAWSERARYFWSWWILNLFLRFIVNFLSESSKGFEPLANVNTIIDLKPPLHDSYHICIFLPLFRFILASFMKTKVPIFFPSLVNMSVFSHFLSSASATFFEWLFWVTFCQCIYFCENALDTSLFSSAYIYLKMHWIWRIQYPFFIFNKYFVIEFLINIQITFIWTKETQKVFLRLTNLDSLFREKVRICFSRFNDNFYVRQISFLKSDKKSWKWAVWKHGTCILRLTQLCRPPLPFPVIYTGSEKSRFITHLNKALIWQRYTFGQYNKALELRQYKRTTPFNQK